MAVLLALPTLIPIGASLVALTRLDAELWSHLTDYVLPQVLPNTLWLLAGVIVYSIGAIIYATHKEGKMWGMDGHDLWHFFVLGGSAAHLVAVLMILA